MKIIKTNIDGVIIVEPTIFKDDRGYFLETYNQANLKEMGISTQFVQDNESSPKYGVIRELHCQTGEHAVSKCITNNKIEIIINYAAYTSVDDAANNLSS